MRSFVAQPFCWVSKRDQMSIKSKFYRDNDVSFWVFPIIFKIQRNVPDQVLSNTILVKSRSWFYKKCALIFERGILRWTLNNLCIFIGLICDINNYKVDYLATCVISVIKLVKFNWNTCEDLTLKSQNGCYIFIISHICRVQITTGIIIVIIIIII